MEELFQNIVNLPNPAPTDEECHEISKIINSFAIKDKDEFQAQLKLSKTKFRPAVIEYMSKWFEVAKTLVLWEKHVNTAWLNLAPEKTFGNDELLPLTILLLSNDIEQLKTMQENLNLASRIESGDIVTFLLVNFHSAVTVKLFENGSEIEQNSLILQIENEVHQVIRIEQLKIICMAYLNYLLVKMNEIRKDKARFPLHTQEHNFSSEFFDILAEEMTATNSPMNCILEKYIVLADMYLTLIRDNMDSRQKLVEFAAKFSHHLVTLKTKNQLHSATSFMANFFKAKIRFDIMEFSNKIFPNVEEVWINKIALITTNPPDKLVENDYIPKISI